MLQLRLVAVTVRNLRLLTEPKATAPWLQHHIIANIQPPKTEVTGAAT